MNDRDTRRRTPATTNPPRRDEPAGTPSAQAEPRATGDGTPDPKPQNAANLLPSVTTPKGGGAIRGLDEKLSVDAATGTCATSVRIPLSPGRSGFTPSLSLSYGSGSGNGPLGFGWSLRLPEITRKTDKGLPRHRHGDQTDVFVLTGADDLVPVLSSMPPLEFEYSQPQIGQQVLTPRPGQPGQPTGRAGRQQVPVDVPGRRGPVRHPDRLTASTRLDGE